MTLSHEITTGATDLLAAFLDASGTICVIVTDSEGVVREVNRALARLLGCEPEAVVGVPLRDLLTETDGERLERQLVAETLDPGARLLLNVVDLEHAPHTLECSLGRFKDGFAILGERVAAREEALQKELLELNSTLAVLSRENVRKGRELQAANSKLEETLADLNSSYWHLRKIQEVLPICMECGRVKTAEASWESVLDYLRKNSLFLSHGYCPDCAIAMRQAWGLDPGTKESK